MHRGNASTAANRQDASLAPPPHPAPLQSDQPGFDDNVSLSANLNLSDASPLSAPPINHSIVPVIEANQLQGKKISSPASRVSPASSIKRVTSAPPSHDPRTHAADVVAPNTITYLNRPAAKPTVVKPQPQHAARSHKHDPVVAARSVAALNAKPAPKAGPVK